jgi:hypothetical protein
MIGGWAFIPILFKISVIKNIPMTRLVNQIIKDYLDRNCTNESDKVDKESS